MTSDITEFRKLGVAQFEKAGLPSRKLEDWHYTDLSQSSVSKLPLAEEVRGSAQAGLIHMVNGFLQGTPKLPEGVVLEGCLEGSRIGTLLAGSERSMTALNAGLFNDAIVLRATAKIEQPVEILSEARGDVQFHGRLLVVVEAGASLTLSEIHRGAGAGFANWVGEIFVAEGGSLAHVKLQDDSLEATHVAALGIELGKRAKYRGALLQVGAKLARHEVLAILAGEEAEFVLDGATLAVGTQHIDNTTRIIHRAPRCDSRQLFKTVLDEQGHGVFQGTVFVERTAQKTNAHQLSRALMLSDRAAMDNKPELEIYADDVKCGHGATIGDIDGDALFYLKSRGIDDATARRLLIEAFLGEVAERVEVQALREGFEERLFTKLAHLFGSEAV
jgi:Fe-S cluster assembly protein SufD